MSTTELDHHAISACLRLTVAERTDQPPAVLYSIQHGHDDIELSPLAGLNWMLDSLAQEGTDLSVALETLAEWERACPLDHSTPECGGLAGLALRVRGTGVSADAPPGYLALLAAAYAAGADVTGMPGTMRVHSGIAVCIDGTTHHAIWTEGEPAPKWVIEKPGDEPFSLGPVREALERLWKASVHRDTSTSA